MLRLMPTVIQISPEDVEKTRHDVDIRRTAVNMRAQVIMHRSIRDSNRETVVLRARRGPQRSRDAAIVHQADEYNAYYSTASSETDELTSDSPGQDRFDRTDWAFSSLLEHLHDSSIVAGSNAVSAGVILPFRPSASRRRQDSGIEFEEDVSNVHPDGNKTASSTDHNERHVSDAALTLSSMAGSEDSWTVSSNGTQLVKLRNGSGSTAIRLPYRARTRERSSSDSFVGLTGPAKEKIDESLDSGKSVGSTLRCASQPDLGRLKAPLLDLRESSSMISSDRLRRQLSSPPSAIEEAVKGFTSPLDAFLEGVTINGSKCAEHSTPNPISNNRAEDADAKHDLTSNPDHTHSENQAMTMPSSLSRHAAVRMTPARRRQHARTSYTERHLQPNFAALRASRPSSEGSSVQATGRRMPRGDQENLDEEERLTEARRVWLSRGRTGGILGDTPPREGRFERYL